MDKLIKEYQIQARLVENCRAEIITLQERIAKSPLGKALAVRHKLLAKYHDGAKKAKKRLDKAVLKQFKMDGVPYPHPCIKIRTYSTLDREWGMGRNGPTVYVSDVKREPEELKA